MRLVQTVRATPRYTRAIDAVAELLGTLRMEFVFVGSVARSAWLGSNVERGSLDLIAVMSAEQKNNVAMMASNRGFRVDREEIEQSEELDLVPLNFGHADGEVRVNVLVASNALYGRMVAAGVAGAIGERPLRVARIEDLALLFAVAEDEESLRVREMLVRLPEFDRAAYNRRMISIGLPDLVVAE